MWNFLSKFTIGNILSWFTGTNSWVAFAKHWLGSFTFRVFGYPKFPLTEYFNIEKVYNLDPNALYFCVCADTSSLEWQGIHLTTNGGTWGHCGVIHPGDNGLWVYHMKASGLNSWHLLDFLKECDNFALLKLPLTPEQLTIAKARLDAILSVAPRLVYNYQIEMDQAIVDMLAKGQVYTPEEVPSKEYCSQLLYMVGAGIAPGYTMNNVLGRPRFEPDGVYRAGQVVYEHRAVEVK
jgi:hypothetical protein